MVHLLFKAAVRNFFWLKTWIKNNNNYDHNHNNYDKSFIINTAIFHKKRIFNFDFMVTKSIRKRVNTAVVEGMTVNMTHFSAVVHISL